MNSVPKHKIKEQEESQRLHDEFIANGGVVKVIDSNVQNFKAGGYNYGRSMKDTVSRKTKERHSEIFKAYQRIRPEHESNKSAAGVVAQSMDMNIQTVLTVVRKAKKVKRLSRD